jgi:hypothetical protein
MYGVDTDNIGAAAHGDNTIIGTRQGTPRPGRDCPLVPVAIFHLTRIQMPRFPLWDNDHTPSRQSGDFHTSPTIPIDRTTFPPSDIRTSPNLYPVPQPVQQVPLITTTLIRKQTHYIRPVTVVKPQYNFLQPSQLHCPDPSGTPNGKRCTLRIT